MRRRTLLRALCSAFVVALPASASADTVAITPPAAPPPEDAAFALTLTGTVDIRPGDGPYLNVVIRPAGGVPCAANAGVDAGRGIFSGTLPRDGGSFQKPATYTPEAPGDYLVCAWINELGRSQNVYAGPVSTTVTVRAPNLSANLQAPSTIRPGGTLPVSIDYSAEVSRYLSVVFAQAADCGISADALRGSSARYAEVYNETVSGAGHADKAAAVPTAAGQYRLCAFFTQEAGSSDPAQLVVAGPVVTVALPTLKCANVRARRKLSQIRAIGISCGSARSVARRWGTPRRTPRVVGSYTCRTASGKRVTCTGPKGKVTFRYRR